MLHKRYVVLVVALVSALALCLGVASSVSARASAKGAPVVGPTTYSDPVNWLAALGVIDTANFDPAANVTRAQFAQMLYVFTRGADDGAAAFIDKHTRFTDIQGHWAEGYVKYLTHIRVVNDGPRNGSWLFQPDSPITGYEMLRMVALLIGSPSLRHSLSGSDWQIHTLHFAVPRSLTEAYPKLRLDGPATGEAAAVVLSNTLDVSFYYPDDPRAQKHIGFDAATVFAARGPNKDADGHYKWLTPRLTRVAMKDGTVLEGKLWIPRLQAGEKVPVIMSGTPYRSTISSGLSGSQSTGSYWASHGYGWLTIDLRGSGNSGGILQDEYVQQEQDDVIQYMNWVTAQPWCTGDAGMMGASWAGFQALQVAANQPKHLKAIISAASTDDRYNDDVHYMGGNVIGNEMLDWSAYMLMLNALPPEAAVVGDDWYSMWMNRLQNTPQPIDTWMSHQLRDSFWKHGSVIEDYSAVKVPVLVVGGWSDGYTNGAVRMMNGLTSPHKAIIGPWVHGYGNTAVPAPNIGFLQESVRWFDYWLKGQKNGIMKEPDLRFYEQDAVPPQTYYDSRPGRWVGIDLPEATQMYAQALNGDMTLSNAATATQELSYQSNDMTTGFGAGDWCPTGGSYDWPVDQSSIDARSLSFTSSAPLTQDLEILGFTKVNLRIAADKLYGQVIVRLNDVAPDGQSTLIARGALNLRSRDGQDRAVDLVPGKFYNVHLLLKGQSYVVPTGHKLRVAINTNYFPWFWPDPETVQIKLQPGAQSMVQIPVLNPLAPRYPVSWLPPEGGKSNISRLIDYSTYYGTSEVNGPFVYDPATSTYTSASTYGGGTVYYYQSDYLATLAGSGEVAFSIQPEDPLSATAVSNYSNAMTMSGVQVSVDTKSSMSVTDRHYVVTTQVMAYKDGVLVKEINRTYKFPRLAVQ